MSKFCFKCGATVDSDAEICTNCGAPFGAPMIRPKPIFAEEVPEPLPAAPQPEVPQPEAAPEAPVKLSKKLLVTVTVIAAAILTLQLVAFGLLGYFTFFTSDYTDPIDLYFSAMYAGKAENVEKLAPGEYWQWRAEQTDMSRDECVEEAQEWAKTTYKMLTKAYGEDFTYTYQVAGKEEMSEEALRELAEILERDYEISASSVKQGYTVTIDVNFAGDEQLGAKVTVVKIGHRWYWVEKSLLGDLAYFPVGVGASIY